MAKEICISTTPHETRLAILEDDQLAEIYYERENEYTLAGSIYKGRVTRVLPGMQSSFVDVGLERDAFLYVTDFLEEQEDGEEYETSGGNGQASQARRGGGSERSADEAQPATAAAGEDRRGRREGRRGDGRRGGPERSERTERTDRGEAAEPAPRTQGQEERTAATAALRTAQPIDTDREEKGDTEAPEGTRRWRGRRGRRRGGMRAGVLGTSASRDEDAGALPPTAVAPFALPEHGAPGGLAAPSPTDREVARAGASELETAAPDEQEPGTDTGSVELQASAMPVPPTRQRDRRETPAVSASAPAGAGVSLLPGESLSRYGGAPAADTGSKPTAPLATPARPVNYTAPKPATMVETVEGWDGGALLPGETISRYKAPASPEPVGLDQVAAESDPRQVAAAPLELDGEFTTVVSETHAEAPHIQEQAEVSSQQYAIAGSDASPEAAVPEQSPAHSDGQLEKVSGSPSPDVPEAVGTPVEYAVLPETVAEALPGEAHPEQLTTTAEVVGETGQTLRAVAESETAEAEYEPTNGEASVRLSPPATSELRLSQLFGGSSTPARVTEEGEENAQTAKLQGSEEAPVPAWEPEEPNRSTLNAGTEAVPGREVTADAGNTPFAGGSTQETSQGFRQHGLEDRFQGTPETESSPALSEEAGLTFTGVYEPGEQAGLSGDPGQQEHPLDALDGLQDGELGEPGSLHPDALAHNDGFTDLVDQLQGFAPGSGLLEEEVIDEDEYDFDPIHASADEQDLEELEEEILEGAYDGDDEEPDSQELRVEGTRAESERSGNLERAREPEYQEDSRDDRAAFALEEIDEDEEEGEGEEQGELAAGSSPDRERTGERGRDDSGRRGGRNGRRRSTGGGGRRQSAQTQDLPIISDLLKQGQEILVQIAKEPIAKKGARITSHIALPGRFLVFMPTVSHVGVSRKIASDEERQRLKRILISEKGDSSGGFIVRTAAEGASEEELRADLRFLISLWTEVKQRSETAKAPALIYHDLNLVERILRDQVSSNFSTIWVDTEQEYERIVRFLNRFQPSLVRRVKLYTKETPLFEHFGIQEEISKALKSKVWLKSGGSIVINQTEALVAIDINTGKYVGKTARLEDTIVKTNLDAIPEIVRQIRLRDLGGIIVIDFIDMDERKNRHRVLAALEEAMKVDRAPSKVLQFNDFGLVAITRKRVKQSLERTLSVQCDTCAGTGMVKSPVTVCNEIYIELRKMMKHLDGKDVMLRVNPEVVKQLKGGNGRWINEYEEMIGKTVIIKSDPSLHPEQFDIH